MFYISNQQFHCTIHLRFFTQFDGETRYLLRCQVEGTEDTEVNGGFITNKAYPINGGNPPCCGSDAFTDNSVSSPTGAFIREATGGSIRITNVPTGSVDLFPPSNIRDLRANKDSSDPYLIHIEFTAPGADYDDGTPDYYELYVANNKSNLLSMNEENIWEVSESELASGTLVPVPPYTPVEMTLKLNNSEELTGTMYFMVQTIDSAIGSDSNIAFVSYKTNVPTTTTYSGTDTVMVSVILLTLTQCVSIMFR